MAGFLAIVSGFHASGALGGWSARIRTHAFSIEPGLQRSNRKIGNILYFGNSNGCAVYSVFSGFHVSGALGWLGTLIVARQREQEGPYFGALPAHRLVPAYPSQHQTLLHAKVTSFFPQLWSANNDLNAPSIARC
jgi:hypothetical protein